MAHFRLKTLAAALLTLGAEQVCADKITINDERSYTFYVISPGLSFPNDTLDITKSGSIKSDNDGIQITRSGVLGGLSNAGNISGKYKGVTIEDRSALNGGLFNSGSISSGQYETGIALTGGSTLSGGLVNTGNIFGDENGLSITGSTLSGGITNSGAISTTFLAGIRIGKGFYDARSYVNGDIINSGIIKSGRSEAGIELYNGQLTGNLVNKSGGAISGQNGVFLNLGSTISGGIENTGRIVGADAGIAAKGADLTGGIVNNGSIEGGVAGIALEGARIGAITNNGTISGVSAISTTTYNSLIAGVTNNGTMTGKLELVVSNGFVNNGRITLPSGSGTSHIGGDLTQNSGGSLYVGVASPTKYAKLVVTGNANLGGKLYVAPDPGVKLVSGNTLKDVIISPGLSAKGLDIDDSLLGFKFVPVLTSYSLSLRSASAGLTKAQNNDTALALEAVSTNLTTVAAAVTGQAPALMGTAGVIDNLLANPALLGIANSGGAVAFNPCTPNAVQVNALRAPYCAVTDASTEAQVTQTVKPLAPLLLGSTQLAATAVLSDINRIVAARQDFYRGLPSGNDFHNDQQVWVKPFGSFADQSDRKGVSGYDAKSWGIAFGADGAFSKATRLGLMFAYANSDVNGNWAETGNNAKIDVFHLQGYGSHSLNEDIDLGFQAGFGRNNNKGRRTINITNPEVPTESYFQGAATSDYRSQTATAGVNLGRTYRLSGQTTVVSSVRADYLWIRDDEYSENGARELSLNVKGRTTDALLVGLDGKLAHEVSKGTFLTANLGLGYDLLNKQASVTSSFVGLPGMMATTQGLEQSPWLVRAGVGLAGKLTNGLELSIHYDAEYRADFLNQTASAKARWTF